MRENENNRAALGPLSQSLILLIKIFYDLNCQDLPEFFEDNMPQFMEFFKYYLVYHNQLLDTGVCIWWRWLSMDDRHGSCCWKIGWRGSRCPRKDQDKHLRSARALYSKVWGRLSPIGRLFLHCRRAACQPWSRTQAWYCKSLNGMSSRDDRRLMYDDSLFAKDCHCWQAWSRTNAQLVCWDPVIHSSKCVSVLL